MSGITAKNQKTGKAAPKVTVQRPSWQLVYDNYPKINGHDYRIVDDKNNLELFKEILNIKDYEKEVDETGRDPLKLYNACATRVSVSLLMSGHKLPSSYRITNQSHKFYGKGGFVSLASDLKDRLEKKWGKPTVTIKSPKSIMEVARKINNKDVDEKNTRNGVYIILGGLQGASGHATLWIGEKINQSGTQGDVIGGHRGLHYVNPNGVIYFWELK